MQQRPGRFGLSRAVRHVVHPCRVRRQKVQRACFEPILAATFVLLISLHNAGQAEARDLWLGMNKTRIMGRFGPKGAAPSQLSGTTEKHPLHRVRSLHSDDRLQHKRWHDIKRSRMILCRLLYASKVLTSTSRVLLVVPRSIPCHLSPQSSRVTRSVVL